MTEVRLVANIRGPIGLSYRPRAGAGGKLIFDTYQKDKLIAKDTVVVDLPPGPTPDITMKAKGIAFGLQPTFTKSGTPLNPVFELGVPAGATGPAPKLQPGNITVVPFGSTPTFAFRELSPGTYAVDLGTVQGPKGDKGDTGSASTTIVDGSPSVSTTFSSSKIDADYAKKSHKHSASDVTGVLTAAQVPALSGLSGKVTAAQVPALSQLQGSVTASQVPALSQLTGSVTAGQLPAATTTARGGVPLATTSEVRQATGTDVVTAGDLTHLRDFTLPDAERSALPANQLATRLVVRSRETGYRYEWDGQSWTQLDTGWTDCTAAKTSVVMTPGAGARPLSVRKVGGVVYLEGGFTVKWKSTTNDEHLVNLPSGFAPPYMVQTTATDAWNVVGARIDTAGHVILGGKLTSSSSSITVYMSASWPTT